VKIISGTLARWIARAEVAVGIYPILAGLACFGAGAALLDPLRAFWIALAVFATVGALDVRHARAKAELHQRRLSGDKSRLFRAIYDKFPQWQPKVVKEFSHEGLRFRAMGFEQYPVAITVAGPLCPRCGHGLAERADVRFPGRARIRFHCACGFGAPSDLTLAELSSEAERLCNAPHD